MRHRAAARNLSSIEEQYSGLAGLVALANADLDAATDAEVETLVTTVAAILPGAERAAGGFDGQWPAGGGLVYQPTDSAPPTFQASAWRDGLRALRAAVRQVLSVVTSSVDVVSGLQPLAAELLVMGDAQSTRVLVRAPLRDLVLLRALSLIERRSFRDRIRSCPECRAFFLRAKRQTFCSDRCRWRANFRARPKRTLTRKQRVRRAERAHRYYEEKQRRLHGKHVKVERRPRLKPPARPRRKSR